MVMRRCKVSRNYLDGGMTFSFHNIKESTDLEIEVPDELAKAIEHAWEAFNAANGMMYEWLEEKLDPKTFERVTEGTES